MRIRSDLRLLVVRTMPFSVGSIPTVFAFARPEYLKELIPVKLFGSSVSCAPALPIPDLRLALRFRRWAEVSFTTDQTTSGEQFAILLASCRGRGSDGSGSGEAAARPRSGPGGRVYYKQGR